MPRILTWYIINSTGTISYTVHFLKALLVVTKVCTDFQHYPIPGVHRGCYFNKLHISRDISLVLSNRDLAGFHSALGRADSDQGYHNEQT